MGKVLKSPEALLGPLPAILVSCGTVDKPNVMTASWTGIMNSQPPMTYVSIRPGRRSHQLIKETGEFVLNIVDEAHLNALDLCGQISGNDVEKFKIAKLTPKACEHVVAPQIAECPISIECKVHSINCLGSHDKFLAEIVGIYIKKSYLDKKGQIDPSKADFITYMNGHYFAMGDCLGRFGLSLTNNNDNKSSPNTSKKETDSH
ncbi:MAG: flavin reductase family protein [Alphaproteobacteria bacterium]|nr:flavin reductase family protein [Alphaproteobacteria bacterium]